MPEWLMIVQMITYLKIEQEIIEQRQLAELQLQQELLLILGQQEKPEEQAHPGP